MIRPEARQGDVRGRKLDDRGRVERAVDVVGEQRRSIERLEENALAVEVEPRALERRAIAVERDLRRRRRLG